MSGKPFSKTRYERPDLAKLEEAFERLRLEVGAADAGQPSTLFVRWLELDTDWLNTRTLCEIACARNKHDIAAAADKVFLDEHEATVQEWSRCALRGLLQPPHVQRITRDHGQYFVDFLASACLSGGKRWTDLATRERRLVTRQEELASRDGYDAAALENERDLIFDQLVTVRAEIAQDLGAETYVPIGYRDSKILSIDGGQVAAFREQVKRHIVPVFQDLHAIRQQLRRDPEMLEREEHAFPLETFGLVFGALSPEIGDLFASAVQDGWLDVDARPAMRSWSECYMPATEGRPFVFVKLNGTWADVPEFIHEFGHGFWFSTVAHDPRSNYVPSAEVDEIPSKALVYLTMPWMEHVFGKDAELYRFRKYHAGLYGLLFYCAIDEFETFAYTEIGATIERRNAMWDEILERYQLKAPGIAADWRTWEVPFGSPFYTITYALSEFASQQLWVQQRQDREKAMAQYFTICRESLDLPYLELLSRAGLRSPFDGALCEDIAANARAYVKSIEHSDLV